ncbi:ribosomal subunit interface protein [Candidatus Curtissbacteria bacterium RBG_13_40_7]|uniref:Ribosomal subunit interface protein n=1 Tax=Candidatus Curtissbacteria bacterium RBG_13_40_7 TaxID=1797706 RepID=A0A1F5FUF1_9BACT|nr:MAG: ribosomal subunit interface protein [Candidatus Curtissbacteria bacterium RBG_13_40_7]
MNISISELHIETNPELRAYAEKKSRKLTKYHPRIEDLKIRLISQKSHRGQEQDYYCELTIHVPGRILEIIDIQRDMEKAIDNAVERMKRILVKSREKEISKLHKRGIIGKLLNRWQS